MFPQGDTRIISIDEQPLSQFAIQCQLKDAPGCELVAQGNTLTDLEPLLRQHQPHIAILEAHFPHAPDNPIPAPASLAAVLQCLQPDFPTLKILILASRLEPILLANRETLNIRGYLLKHDPLTLRLPEIVNTLSMGGRFYSKAVIQSKNTLPAPTTNGILTPRQREVLNTILMEPNLCYAQYAKRLGISESTWDSHLGNIYKRLEVNTLTAALLHAVKLGILSLCPLVPNCFHNGSAPSKQASKRKWLCRMGKQVDR